MTTKSKNLVLVIQGTTYAAYVNVLTHCVRHESVNSVYFVGKEHAKRANRDLQRHIGKIRVELEKHVRDHPQIYQIVLDVFPDIEQVTSQLIYLEFSQPQQLIHQLRGKNLLDSRLIIDVTSCGKRLVNDLLMIFMLESEASVGHFELDDLVYNREFWTKSRMYHDLTEGYDTFYHYDVLTGEGVATNLLSELAFRTDSIKVAQTQVDLNESLQDLKQRAYAQFEDYERMLIYFAKNDAKRFFWLYFVIIVMLSLGIAALIALLGWEKMEQWTYIISGAGILLSLLYFGVTQRELKPSSIFSSYFENRRKKYRGMFKFDSTLYENSQEL